MNDRCWACGGTRRITTSSNGSGLFDMNCPDCLPPGQVEPLQRAYSQTGDQTLADYIKRKEEAFKPIPEPLLMDGTIIRQAMSAVERSNPYVASLLREALDKATKM